MDKLLDIQTELEKKRNDLDAAYLRWEELETKRAELAK